MPNPPIPKPSKHHSTGWIIFSILLGLIGIALILFIAMFSYYLWTEKYGSEETKTKISEIFSGKFTVAPGALGGATTIDKNVTSIIHPFNPQFGNPDAKVTIVAFIDFECPFCQQAYPDFERMRDQFGPAVRVVIKNFPVEQLHPHATNAAKAAQCAHKQQKFWPYYKQLFDHVVLTDNALFSYASQVGLNIQQFNTCLTDEEIKQQINTDLTDGLDVGVRGTPTYIVNQQKIEGVLSEEEWNTIILQSLNQ